MSRPTPRSLALGLLAMWLSGCTAAPAGSAPPNLNAGTLPGTMGNVPLPGAAAAGGAAAGGGALGGTRAPGGAETGAALATGPDGLVLTRDNALAMVEATDFVFGKLGKSSGLAGKQEEAVQALVRAWPSLSSAERQGVSQARSSFTQAAQNWEALGPEGQVEFAQAVLTVSVGPQATNQLLAPFTGQGGAATGGGEGGGDSWAQEAADKCKNGSYEDQLFYCHGVISPGAPSAN